MTGGDRHPEEQPEQLASPGQHNTTPDSGAEAALGRALKGAA